MSFVRTARRQQKQSEKRKRDDALDRASTGTDESPSYNLLISSFSFESRESVLLLFALFFDDFFACMQNFFLVKIFEKGTKNSI